YSHYEQQVWLDEDAPKSIATRRALEEVYRPILRTSLTTAIGFGSFALSPIAPVQAFGIWTAVGVIYCLIFSLTAVPALLVLLQPRPRVQPRKQRGGLVQLSAAAILKARWLILGGLAAAIVAAPFGVRQVVVQDSWIAGFAPDSAFATATRAYNDNFFGAHLLLVTVEETPLTTGGQLPASKIADREFRLPGDVIEGATELPIAEAAAALVGCWVQISRDPPSETESYNEWSSWIEAVRVQRGADGTSTVVVSTPQRQGSPRFLLRLRDDETVAWKIWSEGIATPSQEAHIARLQAMIESRTDCRVGGVLGPRDYIETTWFIKHRLDADQRKVPERPFDLRGIWPLYERIRGKERVRELVSRDRLRVLVTVFLKDANYVDTGRLLDALAAYEREELAGTRLQLGYAGDVAVSQSLIDAIVRTQSRSLLLSLLGICLVSMLFLRSFWWGLLCTLPSAMGVLAIFAAMGWGQVPLGVATSMFAGVLLGVGVDFAIHLLSAYRASLAAGLDVRSAWLASFTRVVPAITTNALSVGLGFGVLVVSRVPANAVLGGLIVVGVFACWCGTVLGLPALAAVFGGGRRRDAGEAKRPAHA
ncbi:MAG: MMPL family transporter, partial [Planctomycetota bacterium]